MGGKIRKWYEGIPLFSIEISSKKKSVFKLLENTEVIMLMRRAYIEGKFYALMEEGKLTFEELVEELKRIHQN